VCSLSRNDILPLPNPEILLISPSIPIEIPGEPPFAIVNTR
jgi:hypothetical protein